MSVPAPGVSTSSAPYAADHRLALGAHALGHHDRARVSLHGGHGGARDAGVAGGALDDRHAWTEIAALLRPLQHAPVDAVLHRAGGPVPLDLREQLHALGGDPRQAHQRGVARRSQDRVVRVAVRIPAAGDIGPARHPADLRRSTYPMRREIAPGGLHREAADARQVHRAHPERRTGDAESGDDLAVATTDRRRHGVQALLQLLHRLRIAAARGPPRAAFAGRRAARRCAASAVRAGDARAARAPDRRGTPAAPCRSTCSAAAFAARPSSPPRSSVSPSPGRCRRRRRPRARRGSRSPACGRRGPPGSVARCGPGRGWPSPRRPGGSDPKPSRYFSVNGSRSTSPRSASVATNREAVALWTPSRRPSSVTPSSRSSAISSRARSARFTDWRLPPSDRSLATPQPLSRSATSPTVSSPVRACQRVRTLRRARRGVDPVPDVRESVEGARERRARRRPRTADDRVPHLARRRPQAELRRRGRRRWRPRSRHGLLPREAARHHRRLHRGEGLARRRQHGPQHHDHPLELPLGRVGRDLRALTGAVGGTRGGPRRRHPVQPAWRAEPGARPGRRPHVRATRQREPAERRGRRVARRRRRARVLPAREHVAGRALPGARRHAAASGRRRASRPGGLGLRARPPTGWASTSWSTRR